MPQSPPEIVTAQEKTADTGLTIPTRLLFIILAVAVGNAVFMLPTPAGLSEQGYMYLAVLAGPLYYFLLTQVFNDHKEHTCDH